MKIIIPTELKDIKLSDYLRYKKVVEDNPNDEVFCAISMVSIFCHISIADVMKLTKQDFAEIVETIAKVLDKKPNLVQQFKLNGIRYGFIPNLEKCSLGEYADVDTLIGDDYNTHLLMSVLYRPITRRAGDLYEIEPYTANEDRAELFKELTLDIVFGAIVFFCNLNNELLTTSVRYLTAQMTEQEMEEALLKNGDGITALLDLAENSELNQQTLGMSLFMNHSHYYHT